MAGKIPPLLAPTNISTTTDKSGDVVITWEDPNDPKTPPTAKSYIFSFVPKPSSGSGLTTFDPKSLPAPRDTTPKGRTSKTYSVTFKPGAKEPKADDLIHKYSAHIIAVGDGKAHSNSPAGIQAFWHTVFQVQIEIGQREFTLTQESLKGKEGIYHLPITKDDSIKVTYKNLHDFAKNVGLNLPEHWPNGKPIDPNGHLDMTKLAMNLPLRLFEIDIAVDMPNLSPIPGVTIKHLEMAVERTDGVHGL